MNKAEKEEISNHFFTLAAKNLSYIKEHNPEFYKSLIENNVNVSFDDSMNWVSDSMKDLSNRLRIAEESASRWKENCDILCESKEKLNG